MKEHEIRMQAKLYALIAELSAAQATVEAMKTENAIRESQGQALTYTAASFDQAAEEMLEISEKLHALAQR